MKKALTVLTVISLAAAMMLAAVAAQTAEAAKSAAKPPTTREMALLCWQEFGELVPARIETVLVPFGSLDPHGVIPSGTDSRAPEAMARDIAARVDALIAPTLNYGLTDAMKAFPGAVSIPGETYAPFAEAVLDNLAANGFKNVIVLNGHGGNTTVLNAAAAPVASTILLYEKGQGAPTFDAGQAKEYFRKVNDRVAELILDTVKKWDLAGVYK